MLKARTTIPVSKVMLCTILMPNKGSAVTNKGNTAQCMAQATDVVMPNASQLTLNFIKTTKV
jgi:hypothetical protein